MIEHKRWRLIRWVWGQHKWFEDLETGRIAVCDDSGRTPDEADEGILWLAQDAPLVFRVADTSPLDDYGAPEQHDKGHCRISVDEPDGTGGAERCNAWIIPDPDEWLWVAAEFGMPIEVEYESGRPGYRYELKVTRMPARNPKKPLVSEDDDLDDEDDEDDEEAA